MYIYKPFLGAMNPCTQVLKKEENKLNSAATKWYIGSVKLGDGRSSPSTKLQKYI